MLYGLYISAGGLKLNEYRHAVGVNNLANAETAGFKADRVVIESRPRPADRLGNGRAAPAELARLGGGAWARQTVTDFSGGPLMAGQSTDIALDTGPVADGFLAVQSADGRVLWTRDGRLGLDSAGRLVCQTNGLPVLGESGQPIRLDPSAGPAAFDASGVIRQGVNEVGRLKLATFGQPQGLLKRGGGVFEATSGCQAGPFRGQVVQGFVEASAVDPIRMLAQLIEVSRAYDANANMIRFQDQTLGRAVNDIARIG